MGSFGNDSTPVNNLLRQSAEKKLSANSDPLNLVTEFTEVPDDG